MQVCFENQEVRTRDNKNGKMNVMLDLLSAIGGLCSTFHG